MKTKTIRQKVQFKVPAEAVYAALMDSKKHAAFTGNKARIGSKVGSKISAFGGYIEGRNLELLKGKLIVQEWRSSEWEPGYFSQVSFSFKNKGEGCELSFVHEGVPAADYEDKKQGWIDYYWKPLKEMLEAGKS